MKLILNLIVPTNAALMCIFLKIGKTTKQFNKYIIIIDSH